MLQYIQYTATPYTTYTLLYTGKQGTVNQNDDKVQDIKKKYELRITEMKGELKRMGKQG